MQTYKISDYLVDFDAKETNNWYQIYNGWGCNCVHCQNFLTYLSTHKLPNDLMEILTDFGAIATKPTYVCMLAPTTKGALYQFNFRIVGKVLNDPSFCDSIQFDWGCLSCGIDNDPSCAPNFIQPYFDVMIFLEIEDNNESK